MEPPPWFDGRRDGFWFLHTSLLRCARKMNTPNTEIKPSDASLVCENNCASVLRVPATKRPKVRVHRRAAERFRRS